MTGVSQVVATADWPDLPWAAWEETARTLHMWTQIVGKIRMARSPRINHWWNVPLYVTARGLTTSPVPDGMRSFEIIFDFVSHQLRIECSDGAIRLLPLGPRTVADFYRELMKTLDDMGLATPILAKPVEVAEAIPFAEDNLHKSYDPEYAQRFWLVLLQATRVLTDFRSRYLGKVSPVHFFWGSFDLAVTRFSGRLAPPHPGGVPNLADWVVREAYSHEVSSCGFWPGRPVLMPCSTPTATQSLQASRKLGSALPAPGTIRSSMSSSFRTERCVPPMIPTRRCSILPRAPMMRAPIWGNGIAPRWNGGRRQSRHVDSIPDPLQYGNKDSSSGVRSS